MRYRERVQFYEPDQTSDGYGGLAAGYQAQPSHETRAHFRYLRGSDAVIQKRMAGRNVVLATIRVCAAAEVIGPGWRMTHIDSGRVFDIQSVAPEDDDMHLAIMAEGGFET